MELGLFEVREGGQFCKICGKYTQLDGRHWRDCAGIFIEALAERVAILEDQLELIEQERAEEREYMLEQKERANDGLDD